MLNRFLFLIILIPLYLPAQQGKPFLRAELNQKGEVIVGEPVVLIVDILVPSWFTSAPQFPNIRVENAIALPPERSMNLSERLNGESYAGIRREYKIIPQLPGSYEIEPIAIKFRFALENAKPSEITTLKTRKFKFSAVIPQQARGLSYFISASKLTARQTISPNTDTLEVGDAILRKIEFNANDALAMVIPPLKYDSIPGLKIYPNKPLVEDRGGERGEQRIGRRVESITYMVLDSGSYELPPIEIVWWDLNRKRPRTTNISGVNFTAKIREQEELLFPVEQDTMLAGSEIEGSGNRMKMIYIIISIVVSGLFAYWILSQYRMDLINWLAERKRKKLESEKFYFQQFCKICLQNNPAKTVQTLLAWIEKIGLGINLSNLAEASEDDQVYLEIDKLLKYSYGPNPPSGEWKGEPLYMAVKRFRTSYLKSGISIETKQLQPLNPV